MKYALVEGKREQAKKGLVGLCDICDSELIPKCGEKKIHHWAHKNGRNCDEWGENETPWHRDWKNKFPEQWQEKTKTDEETGEAHRADVETDEGWVIELQHSYISPIEKRSRNKFYKKLIWIIDANRLKKPIVQLKRNIKLDDKICIKNKSTAYRVKEKFSLLEDWIDQGEVVFLDFGGDNFFFIYPAISDPYRQQYFAPMNKSKFIEYLESQNFSNWFEENFPSKFELEIYERKKFERRMDEFMQNIC